MTLPDRARAAILACPGHWTPATLARQLRVDVAELEPALATLRGLQRDTWRGVLSLPAEARRQRRRPYPQVLAVLRRYAGHELTLGELAGALAMSPRQALTHAQRHGACCTAPAGSRGATWRMPVVVPDLSSPDRPAPRPREARFTLAQRLAWLRDRLAAGDTLTSSEAAVVARSTRRYARMLLPMAGAVVVERATAPRGGGRAELWRLP